MKESYREGVASHPGPESCEVHREVFGEALTGESAGPVIEPRNLLTSGADPVTWWGRPHWTQRHRERRSDPAGSETPGMRGCSVYGTQEIPRSPTCRWEVGRGGKAGAVKPR
jgi:hypothetical protein